MPHVEDSHSRPVIRVLKYKASAAVEAYAPFNSYMNTEKRLAAGAHRRINELLWSEVISSSCAPERRPASTPKSVPLSSVALPRSLSHFILAHILRLLLDRCYGDGSHALSG